MEESGATPLHITTQNGHSAVAQLLLAARCNIHLKTIDGKTASQGIQVRGVSPEQDDEDDLPDVSSAKSSSKVNKKRGGDQRASACKTAPWATEAKKVGSVAAGVGVEAESRPATLQADVQKAVRIMSAAEAEALFMSKFGNLSVGGEGGETDTGAEAGSDSGEVDDVFKSMVTEYTVCMQESKVRLHQLAYFVDDLYSD
jgi:hypothetical protein